MRLPCLGIPKNNDIYTFYNRKFPTYEYCAILTANKILKDSYFIQTLVNSFKS